MAEGNMHIASKFVDVINGQVRADVSMLSCEDFESNMCRFRDPDSFVAGNLQTIFQPGSKSPKLPRLILRPRFCCGSRTVLTCEISFNLLKVNIGEKTWFGVTLASDFFLRHRLVNCLLNLFLIPWLIDLLRIGAIYPWGRVGEVPPPHLVMPFMWWQAFSLFVEQGHAISAWFSFIRFPSM